MMRDRYSMVMRAYPADYRRRHGVEIAATANELGAGVWSWRQALALLTGGLRTRSRATVAEQQKNAWGQAVATVFGLLTVAASASSTAFLLGVRGDVITMEPDPRVTAIASGLLVVLVSFRLRWWVVLPVGGNAIWLPLALDRPTTILVPLITHSLLVCGALLWATLRTNVRRAFPPGVALLLYCAAVAAAVAADNLSGVVFLGGVLMPTLVLGVAIVRIDPRLVAMSAVAVLWSLTLTVPMTVAFWADYSSTDLAIAGIHVVVAIALCWVSRSGLRHLLRPI